MQKPIFIAIINQRVCPNNQAIVYCNKWFNETCSACKYGYPDQFQIVNTARYKSAEDFQAALALLVSSTRSAVCFYFCMHGRQLKDSTGKINEYLVIGTNGKEDILMKDETFSALINSFKIEHLYMFNEICHSGGLLDYIKIDYNDNALPDNVHQSVLIVNTCAKQQKSFYEVRKERVKSTTYKEDYISLGVASTALYRNNINPFLNPVLARDFLKSLKLPYGLESPSVKITYVQNLI